VVPIVLYNGKNKWTAATHFRDYTQGAGLFDPYILDFQYLLFSVNEYTEKTLMATENLINTIFLLDRQEAFDGLLARIHQAVAVLQKLSPSQQEDLRDWLRHVLLEKVAMKGVSNADRVHIADLLASKEVETVTYAIERIFDTEMAKSKAIGLEIGEKRGEERGLKIGEKRGQKRGLLIGEKRGEILRLITLIERKRAKGKTREAIIEELEMDPEEIDILDNLEAYKQAHRHKPQPVHPAARPKVSR
jgi:hypothetical protein